MKNIGVLAGVLLIGLASMAQSELPGDMLTKNSNPGKRGGTLQGEIKTTDNQPAAFVTVIIKGTDKISITDEKGFFILQNIREGHYFLEVSMIGLRTIIREVHIQNDTTTVTSFTLEENARQLDDVIITARKSLNEKITSIGKLPAPPKDLPQSIVIIDKPLLERQQVNNMSDALQNVNGVYIMGTTGGFQEEIAARGYAFSSSNTFKNGARFNNGVKTEFSSVEKIEVLKGGNAILYGNVGAGGILNIITKKPKYEPGGSLTFRAGSNRFYKPSFDIYGPFGKSRLAAFRLNGSYENAGSFREGVSSERIYLNPSFSFRLGKQTELLVEGDFLKENRTPDYGIGAINYSLVNVPRTRTLNVPWAYLHTKQSTATTTFTHHFGKSIQLRAVASFQNFGNELFSAVRPASTSISYNGTWIRGLQKSKMKENYYFMSADLTAKWKTGTLQHIFLFGGDADQYKTDVTTFIVNRYNNSLANNSLHFKNVYDTINIFDPSTFNLRKDVPYLQDSLVTTTPVTRYGIYFQDLISITGKIKLLAGIRYSVQENRTSVINNRVKGVKTFIHGSYMDAFSPRIGIVFQPVKSTSLFASYTNSFTSNTGTDVYGKTLRPSIIDQVEAGVKNEFFNGVLTTNLTLYRIVNSNLAQTALYEADGITVNTNSNIRELSGETTSKGFELDIMTKPINGFQLIGGYSYNDMRYTRVNGNNVNGNQLNDRLRYNPSHTANASIYYSFGKSSILNGLYVGTGAFYVGDRLAGRNPTNNPGNTNRLMPLPDYLTMDVHAGYVLGGCSIRVRLSNLFDQLSYNAHDDNSINPIAARQFTATLSYKF